MALQLSVAARNGALDALETAVGTSAVLKFRTGSPPANCAAADTGTVIGTLNLPSDWWAAASSGSKAKAGTWEDTSADNSGDIAHFRIYDSGATTCHIQGTVTATGGGGDLTVNTVTVTAGQTVTVTGFTITAPNS